MSPSARGSVLAPLLGALALLVLATPGANAAWPTCIERITPPVPAASLAERSTEGRVVTLKLDSRAMGNQQTVNVLLPSGYNPSGKVRYSVLYLLHGAGGDNRLYLDGYDLPSLVGGMPLIVVMPDGSGPDDSGQRRNGGYADWFGVEEGGPGPAFAWETFHIRELVPFIDRSFPTIARAGGRAIAGISMGGGGAMKYSAAYPGTFGYAGSFSGELYPELPEAQAFQTPNCKYGDPAREEVVWRDNDPTVLAGNLRGLRLFVRSGDGTPGPLDVGLSPEETAVLPIRLLTEYGAGLMAKAFLAANQRAGTPVEYELYPGSHSKRYWSRELPEFFAWLREQLAHKVKDRRTFTVESARRWFSAWGWTFKVRRGVREFLYVKATRGTRMRLTGSGRVKVRSAALFKPGRLYAVRVGREVRLRRADRRRRLTFPVGLGPSHAQQQTSFTPESTAGWKSVRIKIGKVRRG
jgi:diacylglycerol O-acyltransferase / trehalose O-mycolyltransferase